MSVRWWATEREKERQTWVFFSGEALERKGVGSINLGGGR